MSEQPHPEQSPASCAPVGAAAGRRRRILLFVVVALLALAVIVPVVRRELFDRRPLPPEVDVTGVDRLVVGAIEKARAAVEKNRSNGAAWGHLGKVFRAHEFYDEADFCFDRAAELDPREARWPYLIARGPRCTNPDVARLYLERAVERSGTELVPRLALGEILYETGRPEDARRQFLAVIEQSGDDPRAHLGLGRIALAQGALETALDHLRRSSAAAPNVKATGALLAEAYSRSGDNQAVEAELRRLAGLHDDWMWPDPWLKEVVDLRVGLKSRLVLADDLFKQGRGDEAILTLQAAVGDYPHDSRGHLSLGQTLNRLGRCGPAEKALRRALQMSPSSGIICFELGYALQQQDRGEEAAEFYEAAIGWQPNPALAHLNLSMILADKNDLAGCERELRAALRFEPDLAQGYLNLARLLAGQGKIAGALSEIERAAELAPGDRSITAFRRELREQNAGEGR
jgi:tetratricopeptide (TPR) repeat protein